ncbi:hypothetical protein L798_09688 [Zootermopsis nevadensis]|uniref:Uncharacterized protein n=1 Tax=Zootermopsis nevadensis TaxID=136037 RepID=A0A067R9I0_ZOONE|nr:hypothetical protein L798_09688 [Zootermopsis nevadensis]
MRIPKKIFYVSLSRKGQITDFVLVLFFITFIIFVIITITIITIIIFFCFFL